MDRRATYPRHSAIPDRQEQVSQTLLALDPKDRTSLPAPWGRVVRSVMHDKAGVIVLKLYKEFLGAKRSC